MRISQKGIFFITALVAIFFIAIHEFNETESEAITVEEVETEKEEVKVDLVRKQASLKTSESSELSDVTKALKIKSDKEVFLPTLISGKERGNVEIDRSIDTVANVQSINVYQIPVVSPDSTASLGVEDHFKARAPNASYLASEVPQTQNKAESEESVEVIEEKAEEKPVPKRSFVTVSEP